MHTPQRLGLPDIVPHLVFPFERPYFQGKCRFPALVFARCGSLVLFAVEYQRQFGVGFLDGRGAVVEPDHFPTLDGAARVFIRMASVPA
jgi:hypothetical protein